jgi:hypothetical protein
VEAAYIMMCIQHHGVLKFEEEAIVLKRQQVIILLKFFWSSSKLDCFHTSSIGRFLHD